MSAVETKTTIDIVRQRMKEDLSEVRRFAAETNGELQVFSKALLERVAKALLESLSEKLKRPAELDRSVGRKGTAGSS